MLDKQTDRSQLNRQTGAGTGGVARLADRSQLIIQKGAGTGGDC